MAPIRWTEDDERWYWAELAAQMQADERQCDE